jgi:hypothetical protein
MISLSQGGRGGNTPSATPSLESSKELEHSARLYDIPPLEDDGKNYVCWKFRTETLLKLWDLWGIVNGDVPKPDPSSASDNDERAAAAAEWSHKDLEARAQITLTLKDDPLRSVLDATTAKECWDKLSAWYMAKWEPQIYSLLRRVIKREFSDGEPLEPQIDDLLWAARMMESIGQKIDDNLIVLSILCALPSSLSTLRGTIVSNADKFKLSSEQLRSQLVRYEQHRSGAGAKKGR